MRVEEPKTERPGSGTAQPPSTPEMSPEEFLERRKGGSGLGPRIKKPITRVEGLRDKGTLSRTVLNRKKVATPKDLEALEKATHVRDEDVARELDADRLAKACEKTREIIRSRGGTGLSLSPSQVLSTFGNKEDKPKEIPCPKP